MMLRPSKVATSIEEVGRLVTDLGLFRAHDAGDDKPALLVGDDEHLLVQRPSGSVE